MGCLGRGVESSGRGRAQGRAGWVVWEGAWRAAGRDGHGPNGRDDERVGGTYRGVMAGREGGREEELDPVCCASSILLVVHVLCRLFLVSIFINNSQKEGGRPPRGKKGGGGLQRPVHSAETRPLVG